MVRAVDCHRSCEATFACVDVICDVREEIGVLAAFFHPLAHHAVLIVPEVGRLEPESAVLLVGMPRPHQPTQRLLDLAGRVQGRLEKVTSNVTPKACRSASCSLRSSCTANRRT